MRAAAVAWLGTVACAAAVPSICAAQDTSPVLVDRHMTAGAGATVVATAGEIIARAEDALVPHRLFAGRGPLRRAGNVAFRVARLTFFDLPQEQLLLVVSHEIFGHGARLRERFDGRIRYRIDAPFPFGRGGGSTSFELTEEPTTAEWLAVSAAGMEVDAVAAGMIASRAFVTRRIGMREAIRYLGFELDTVNYVLSTGDQPERPGHDVFAFLQTYNEAARSAGADELTARALRRQALVGLANPMLGYSLFAIGRYVWTGAGDGPVPALALGPVRYLPYLRYRLAPFGTEWAIVNELDDGTRPLRVEARFGRSPETRTLGFGVHGQRLDVLREWRIAAGLELWRQPPLGRGASPTTPGPPRWGAHVRGRAERSLSRAWFGDQPPTLIVDLGLKTQGFVPGEPLGSGTIVRVGLGVALPR